MKTNIEHLRELYKLKCIIRYNNRRHIKNENVAEHSFYVAIISLELAREYGLDEHTSMCCVIKALLHDTPEMEINDITHDTKTKLGLIEFLQKYEFDYYDRKFPEYAELMKTTDDITQAIVDLADTMSVVQFADNELLLGNVDEDMKEIARDASHRVDVCRERVEKLLNV